MGNRDVVHGIVLRTTDTKETDRILTVLTANMGRIAVIAKGVRRKNNALAASCQLFAFSELVLKKRNGWFLLEEASIISLFDRIRKEVILLSLASYFSELLEMVTEEGVEAGEMLSLFLNALYALDVLKKPEELVRAAFELKLLSLSGYEPSLASCAVCGTSDAPFFDTQHGVLFCASCLGKRRAILLHPAALSAMRHILSADHRKILSFRLDKDSEVSLSNACESFAEMQLEYSFRSLRFYKSMLQMNGGNCNE